MKKYIMMTRIRAAKESGSMLTRKRKANHRWEMVMIVMCVSLRIFWHIRPMISGAAGRRDIGKIQVVLKYEAKWV